MQGKMNRMKKIIMRRRTINRMKVMLSTKLKKKKTKKLNE